MVALLAIGALRHDGDLRFSPSRAFAFQSFSLLVIGAYLVVDDARRAGRWPMSAATSRGWSRSGFVALAGAVALTVLPSRRLRGWLRVTLAKHLFQHRYDYRAEWLRFTDTMGRAGADAAPLRERVVKALADITDSPARPAADSAARTAGWRSPRAGTGRRSRCPPKRCRAAGAALLRATASSSSTSTTCAPGRSTACPATAASRPG